MGMAVGSDCWYTMKDYSITLHILAHETNTILHVISLYLCVHISELFGVNIYLKYKSISMFPESNCIVDNVELNILGYSANKQ